MPAGGLVLSLYPTPKEMKDTLSLQCDVARVFHRSFGPLSSASAASATLPGSHGPVSAGWKSGLTVLMLKEMAVQLL